MADEKKTDSGVAVTEKHKRTTAARGNGGIGLASGNAGGDLDTIGKISEHAIAATLRPTDIGDRETVSPGDVDKIFTADSKDRWDDGQPTLQDLLKASRTNEDRLAKEEAKNR